MSQFKTYSAEDPCTGETIFIITTAFLDMAGNFQAESFLIVSKQKNKPALYSSKLQINIDSEKESLIELNINFMQIEAFNQAKIDLGQHFFERFDKGGRVCSSTFPVFVPCENNQLAHLWVREHYRGQLTEINKRTKYQPLKDFLERIMKYPTLILPTA